MILLKDFNRYDRYIELGSKEEYIDSSLSSSMVGWFYESYNSFSALYIEDSILYFLFDEYKTPIHLNQKIKLSKHLLIDATSTSLKLYQREFKLYEIRNLVRETLILSFNYNIEEFYKITMEEEEDFDWGLFIANIFNNKKRQKFIIDLFNKKKTKSSMI